jgi:acetoin utilization protein AcuB
MTIAAIPLEKPVCISPDTPALDALRLLIRHGFNHLPVCDASRLVGILGINDLMKALLPVSAKIDGGLADLSFVGDANPLISTTLAALYQTSARELMHQPEFTLRDSCPLLEAALLLSRANAPLPVLDAQGQFRGMLSRRQLIAHFMNSLATQ